MTPEEPSSIQTRPSLLSRLKRGDDTEGWKEFYLIYSKLVRDFAIQAGLTDAEADEVVQETAIAAARHLPEYQYDPKVCRFKTWLLNQASWRVKDQFKKRKKFSSADPSNSPPDKAASPADGTSRTTTLHQVPDSTAANLEELFDAEWRKNLFALALKRVKGKFSLKQFQVFDLLVMKERPAADVTRSLGITLANVYVTRHRVAAAVEKEARRLEQQFEQAARDRIQTPAPITGKSV